MLSIVSSQMFADIHSFGELNNENEMLKPNNPDHANTSIAAVAAKIDANYVFLESSSFILSLWTVSLLRKNMWKETK